MDTCKGREQALSISLYLLEKYLPNYNITVLGYGDCDKSKIRLGSNSSFIVMDSIQRGAVTSWATYLKNYFSDLEDEVILRVMDDHFISDIPNSNIYDYLEKLMYEDSSIGRIDLTRGAGLRKHKVLDDQGSFRIVETTPDQDIYRITTQFSFWRTKYLLNFLNEGWTPWDFELKGSPLSKQYSERLLGCSKNWAINQVEGTRHFAPKKINMLGLKKEDILYLLYNEYLTNDQLIGEQEWL